MVAVVLVATGPPASAAMGNMNPDGTWVHNNISSTLGSIQVQAIDSSAIVYVYDGNTTSGTAYCTDVGMTGPQDSVIGVKKELVIKRFLDGMPASFEPSTLRPGIRGVLIETDDKTGKAKNRH